MYADDTCVIAKFNDVNNLILSLNQELAKFSKLSIDNHLTLNVQKMNYDIFHRNKRHLPVTLCQVKIDSKTVDRVFEIKFLGAVVSEHFKFNSHVINVTKKISKFALIFHNIRKLLTKI